MDELTALFGSLGISTEVISIVNEDMIAMARHYITQIDSIILILELNDDSAGFSVLFQTKFTLR